MTVHRLLRAAIPVVALPFLFASVASQVRQATAGVSGAGPGADDQPVG